MSTTKQRPGLASSHELLERTRAMLPEISAAADETDDARRVPGLAGGPAGRRRFLPPADRPGTRRYGCRPGDCRQGHRNPVHGQPVGGWVTMILATASFWTVRMAPEEVRREIFAEVSPGEIQPTVIAGTLVPHGQGRAGRGRLAAQRPVALRQRLPSRHLDAHRRLAARRGRPHPRRQRSTGMAGLPPSGFGLHHTGHLVHLRPAGNRQHRLHHGRRLRGRQLRQETLPSRGSHPSRQAVRLPRLQRADALGGGPGRGPGRGGRADGAVRRQGGPPQPAPGGQCLRQAGRPRHR